MRACHDMPGATVRCRGSCHVRMHATRAEAPAATPAALRRSRTPPRGGRRARAAAGLVALGDFEFVARVATEMGNHDARAECFGNRHSRHKTAGMAATWGVLGISGRFWHHSSGSDAHECARATAPCGFEFGLESKQIRCPGMGNVRTFERKPHGNCRSAGSLVLFLKPATRSSRRARPEARCCKRMRTRGWGSG